MAATATTMISNRDFEILLWLKQHPDMDGSTWCLYKWITNPL